MKKSNSDSRAKRKQQMKYSLIEAHSEGQGAREAKQYGHRPAYQYTKLEMGKFSARSKNENKA